MTIEKHTIPDTDTVIWAETDNLNYYITTPLPPDADEGVTNKQISFAAHNRRQYPKDASGISVPSQNRVYLFDPGRKNGSAIPGKPFRIDDGTENRMMRYVGRFIDLHSFFVGNIKKNISLYSPAGVRYIIETDDVRAEPAGQLALVAEDK